MRARSLRIRSSRRSPADNLPSDSRAVIFRSERIAGTAQEAWLQLKYSCLLLGLCTRDCLRNSLLSHTFSTRLIPLTAPRVTVINRPPSERCLVNRNIFTFCSECSMMRRKLCFSGLTRRTHTNISQVAADAWRFYSSFIGIGKTSALTIPCGSLLVE